MHGFPLGDIGQLFESDGGVDQIEENAPGSFWFATQKQGCRLIVAEITGD